jgi:uncharacterized protein (TIGR02996 family)
MSEETAFLKAILQEPDDDALRLVYADWLEERGDLLSDLIRVQCSLAQLSPGDPGRSDLLDRTRELIAQHGKGLSDRWRTVAERDGRVQPFFQRLTVSAETFMELETTVLQCATLPSITVDLDDVTLSQPVQYVIEWMPGSVARAMFRENGIFVLAANDVRYLIAMQNPNDSDLLQKLCFIFNRDIHPVLAQSEQIFEAIDRHYPARPGGDEIVDSMPQELMDGAPYTF